ncbi:oligopeptide ABC transporter permease [Sporosalibacterium faouarense]|uniref:oligopeptide ABC transporter permease n=1 Tax=Sporosalibacterium faouarense TaxID=516123 RepID=UPI00141C93DA|nr:oligopeptide ABC transporter permease [Sporosalibacterium faouarense]MTI46401.1 ABC transporter permease [Bacillota bacterium]
MDNLAKKYDKKSFERILKNEKVQTDVVYKGISFWKDVGLRFYQNKGALIGLILIVIIVIMAFVGPTMNKHTYKSLETEHLNLPPRIQGIENLGVFDGEINGVNVYQEKGLDDVYYWFGTDSLGRDIWTRVWVGTQVSIYIALLAVVIDMFIGMGYGLISGYLGGKVDVFMQRFIEILSGIPNLVVVTLFVMILNPGILSISLALVITGWIGMSRVVRSQVLRLKELDFILASRTLGASTSQIIIKDLFPNIFGQVIIMSMFSIPKSIFYESFLAFIGLGLQPPMASLGVLINDGYKSILVYPHMIISPVIVLAILMLSFNLLADGLRDALDPKMKEH